MDDDDNQISELTRRDIFDALRLENVQWAGRLGETDFLSRVFDLTKLPSEDYRASNMLGDVSLHREPDTLQARAGLAEACLRPSVPRPLALFGPHATFDRILLCE
jgi:hypothetical protein